MEKPKVETLQCDCTPWIWTGTLFFASFNPLLAVLCMHYICVCERCYSKPFISCKLLPRNVRKSLVLVVVVVVGFCSSNSTILLASAECMLCTYVRTLAVEFNFTLGGIIIYIWCWYSWRCVKNVWNRMCGEYMAIQNNNESKSIHTKQIHKQRSYKMKTKQKKNSAARQLNSPACIW